MELGDPKRRLTPPRSHRQPKNRNRKPVNKDRFIPKMFLRGDSVVLGECTSDQLDKRAHALTSTRCTPLSVLRNTA